MTADGGAGWTVGHMEADEFGLYFLIILYSVLLMTALVIQSFSLSLIHAEFIAEFADNDFQQNRWKPCLEMIVIIIKSYHFKSYFSLIPWSMTSITYSDIDSTHHYYLGTPKCH